MKIKRRIRKIKRYFRRIQNNKIFITIMFLLGCVLPPIVMKDSLGMLFITLPILFMLMTATDL